MPSCAMGVRSIMNGLRNREGRGRFVLFAALLFQLAIGNTIHAYRMSQDAEWSALTYGVLCTTLDGAGDPGHKLHSTNHECCLTGACCALAAPGAMGQAAWTLPLPARASNVSPRLGETVAVGARYPSDVGARAPPAIVL